MPKRCATNRLRSYLGCRAKTPGIIAQQPRMMLLGANGQCCAGFYNFQGRPGEACLSILLLNVATTQSVFAAFLIDVVQACKTCTRQSQDALHIIALAWPWALTCSANFCFPLLSSIVQCLGTDASRSRATSRWFYCAQVPLAARAGVNLNFRLRFQVC